MSTALCYCPGCGEIVEAAEPCECVFLSRGTIDTSGVLHTARREPLDGEHVLDDWLGWHDEEVEAGLGAQIDAWRDAGASWDEVEALLNQAR